MKKRIIISVIIVALFLINNAFWFGKYIDIGLTIQTRNQQLIETESSFFELKDICLYINSETTKDELLSLLKKKFKEDEIFEKNGSVYSPWLGFKFLDEKLSEVVNVIEYNPDSEG